MTEPFIAYVEKGGKVTLPNGGALLTPQGAQHFEKIDQLARRVCSYADSVVRGAYLNGRANDEYIGGVDGDAPGIRVSTIHGLSQSVEKLRAELGIDPDEHDCTCGTTRPAEQTHTPDCAITKALADESEPTDG